MGQHRRDRVVPGDHRRVDHQVGVARLLVRVGDSGEGADDPGPCLGVQPLAVARLAHLERRRDMHQNEVAYLGDHPPHPGAGRRVGGDRRADRDTAVPGDLGRHEPDAGNVQVPVFPGERESGREQPPHQVAVEQRHRPVAALEQRVAQVPGEGRFPRSGQPGAEHDHAAGRARRPGPAQFRDDGGSHQPGGHRAAGIEQLAEFAVGQLAALQARLDQAERPPDLGGRVVGPLSLGQDFHPELGKIKVSVAAVPVGQAVLRGRRPRPRPGTAAGPGRAARVRQQVGRPVGGGDHGPAAQLLGRVAARRERNRHDERAGRQLPRRGLHGADQGLRAGNEVGRARDQRQQQDPGAQLPGQVPQLADLPLAQRPPGRVREHGGGAEFSADLGRPAAQRPERPVLRRPQRGHRAGQPQHGPLGAGRDPLGDGEDGERRALRILQHQVVGRGRDGAFRHGERDRERPRGAVGQLPARGDGREVGLAEVARQRRERAGEEELEFTQLFLAWGPGRPRGQLRRQVHVRLHLGSRRPCAGTTRTKRSSGLRIT